MSFRCRKHRQPLQKLWQIAQASDGELAGRTIDGSARENKQRPGGWILDKSGLLPGLYCKMCIQEGSKIPLPDYDDRDIAEAGLNDPPHIGLKAADFSAQNTWRIIEKEFGRLVVITRDRAKTSPIFDASLRTDQRLDTSIRTTLYDRILMGSNLWAHQAKAIDAALNGNDVVIETATASGKSLCYWVPILNMAVKRPTSTAIYIAPLNALAEDQMRAVEKFGGEPQAYSSGTLEYYTRSVKIGSSVVRVARYDGSIKDSALRRRISRSSPQVLVTNPDMLHYGILPNHSTIWSDLFGNLGYIVLDELHVYKGMFGAHFANVVRRVLRLAQMHGQRPQIIACSASIGNPSELFQLITGRPSPILVSASDNGAPVERQRRAIIDLGLTSDALSTVAKELAVKLIVKAKARTIVFMRSISEVDQVYRYVLGDVVRAIKGVNKTIIREYKREIPALEKTQVTNDLKSGATLGVISTTALQLGIDIGDLSVCVVCKFPGSKAAFFQQAGRVGRNGESIVVFIADKSPLDQHFALRPAELLDATSEVVYLNPYHQDTVLAHLRLAAEEASLDPKKDKEFWPAIGKYIKQLSKIPGMKPDGREVLIINKRGDAAHEVNIRSLGFECIVRDEAGEEVARPGVLRAVRYFHKYARFQEQEQAYETTNLTINWDNHQAEAVAKRLAKLEYTTASVVKTSCKVLSTEEKHPLKTSSSFDRGTVRFTVTVEGYYKIPVGGSGEPKYQHLGRAAPPYRELDTQGLWFSLGGSMFVHVLDSDRAASVKSANESLKIASALMCSTDPDDLGVHVESQENGMFRMFLTDNAAGGNGLTEQVYHRPLELLDGALRVLKECPYCKDHPESRGCPRCVTTAWGADDEVCRNGGIKILSKLRSELAEGTGHK
ncbi:MAG: DEAD/DEAH box helicase [Dehalococcoidales bacterium]|nr:DEAD/DEAH box helicase [Dehalococcoidales bacterium]